VSRWFRFYAEALDDPKVQKLDGDTFKAWVNLLCLTAKNSGVLPAIDDIAFALRIDVNGARTLVERLLNATLIDKLSGGVGGARYAPHGWQERQYKSDTSTDRVKRFRQRSKVDTETSPETDTEKETESPPKAPRKRVAVTGICFPSDWQLPAVSALTPKAKACAEQWTKASYETEGEGFILYWKGSRKRRPDWLDTWCAWVIRQHSKVMRDQKFGNAPTEEKKALSPEEAKASAARTAELYERMGRTDDAADIRRRYALPVSSALPRNVTNLLRAGTA
jgi:hypothetical protein